MATDVFNTAALSASPIACSGSKFLKPCTCWRCLGQPLALQMELAAVAVLCARFRFELAERMGGPEGVGNSSINRLTLQPKVRCRVGIHSEDSGMSLLLGTFSPYNVSQCTVIKL